ncbi:MAG: 30S ribosomal protein S16 [Bdellovibrionales bacterium]|jgi:small subunit ribosomal protein S16|nr:30S ribosomal protein S16 [Bdellovibrionales bacterium]
MVKIRLARMGRIHKPIYKIVAADARSPRDGKYLDDLGQYDPNAKESVLIGLKTEAMAAWIEKGAVLTDTVRSLLKKNNIKL